MVEAYWEVGWQIEQAVGNRAEYGKGLMQYISQGLSYEFGKSFTVRNLQTMRQFYQTFPNMHTLCAELSWSHYRLLIRIDDKTKRKFYGRECAEELLKHARLEWSVERMHWLLYVHFSEDFCREKDRNVQQNLNIVRKIALNTIKGYKTKMASKSPVSRLMFDCLLKSENILTFLTVNDEN